MILRSARRGRVALYTEERADDDLRNHQPPVVGHHPPGERDPDPGRLLRAEAVSQLFHFRLDLLRRKQDGRRPSTSCSARRSSSRLILPTTRSATSTASAAASPRAGRDSSFTAYRMEIVPQLVAADAPHAEPHLSAHDRPRHPQEGADRPRRLRPSCRGRFEPRNLLRAVPGDRLQLRQPAHGRRGHLLLLQAQRRAAARWCVANTPQSHPDVPAASAADLRDRGRRQSRRRTACYGWEKTQELRSGKVTLWDHCFELPHKHLEASQVHPAESVKVGRGDAQAHRRRQPDLELYDYPGGYAQRFDGVDTGRRRPSPDLQGIAGRQPRPSAIRMQEETAGRSWSAAAATAGNLTSG